MKFTQFVLFEDNEDEVVQLATDTWTTLFLTKKGRLWAHGKTFMSMLEYGDIWYTDITDKVLPEGKEILRIWGNSRHYNFSNPNGTRVIFVELKDKASG